MIASLITRVLLIPLKVCPTAPPGAAKPMEQLTGYVLWGVIALFAVAVAVSVGAIVVGKMMNMPHASKGGVIALMVIALAAITYLAAPDIVNGILGNGCINN